MESTLPATGYLTIEEIESRFDSEWILIDQPRIGEQQQVLGGMVVCHSQDRELVDQAAFQLEIPRNFAVHFTGHIPDGMTIVL